MNIQLLDPATLVPYENNPKNHPPEQIEAIATNIKNTGFDQPIVVDQNLVIIKGHGRRLAAMHLGMAQVPVLVRNVSNADARLNRVLDNKLTSREYDLGALRDDLMHLQTVGLLELALHDEASIPIAEALPSTPEINLFSLATDHKCPKCQYKW